MGARAAVVCLLALTGCEQLFGLPEVHATQPAADAAPPDAPVDDEDGDGVANEADNCPGIPNPDQLDND